MARGKKSPRPRHRSPNTHRPGAGPHPRSPNTRSTHPAARPDASAPARASATALPGTSARAGSVPNTSSPQPQSANTRSTHPAARPDASALARASASALPGTSAQAGSVPNTPGPQPRSPNTFGPAWLATQLATLVPGYPDTPLCVALSGGVDSTALLAALADIHPRLANLRALHVNHGLRPAARGWAQHCRALARRLRVPLKVLTAKVARRPGASLEAAARDVRYDLLASALHPGEVLLLAHHADDQLETVLLQLLRGSGLPGLSAMPASTPFARGLAVRPMLSTSREQLEAWVRAQGLAWIEDDSNADESLNRNYLRRRVLPLLQARWPGAATAVARSARHAAEAQSLLDRLARADIERASYGESLSVKALRALPADRLNNALRFWIARAGLRVPDTRRLAEITGPLLKAREDANPFVEWGEEEGARAQRDGDLLTLTRHGARAARRPTASSNSRPAPTAHPAANDSGAGAHTPAVDSVPSPPPPPAATELPDLIWSWRQSPRFELPHPLGKLQLEPDAHGPIDLDALPHPLTIRWRRGGERLAPRRGGPRRPLKSLLQESHIPASQRRSLPLLFSTAAPSTVPSTPITTPTVATPGASSAPRTPSAPAASGAPSTFSAPGALIAPTTSASAARSGSTASTASTPAVEKLIAVADLLLDETVQATSTTRRRARLRWMKSSP